MNPKLTVLAALLSLLPLSAMACVVPPPGLLVQHTELVQRTETIVWARALGGSGETEKVWRKPYELVLFETIEVLKGEVPARFTLPNGFLVPDLQENRVSLGVSEESDFDSHRNPRFWEEHHARQWNSSDCQMRPTFSVGSRYLLFLGQQHWQGYEKVETEDDLWLTTVRGLLE